MELVSLPSRNDSNDIFKAHFGQLRVDLDGDVEVSLDRRVERHPVPELLGQVLSVHVVDQQRPRVVVGYAHYRNARPVTTYIFGSAATSVTRHWTVQPSYPG